ncbi:hypothetical protein ACYUJ6_02080 [Clostridium sp. JNZ X4-2]
MGSEYLKVKYRGNRFFILIRDLGKVKGMRYRVNGITFIVINEGKTKKERSKIFHSLIKRRDSIFINA